MARNPRITLHFTPTSGSWLNLVEVFFGIITCQAIRRGTFTSAPDLVSAIRLPSTNHPAPLELRGGLTQPSASVASLKCS